MRTNLVVGATPQFDDDIGLSAFAQPVQPALATIEAETNRSLDKIGAGCWYAGQYGIGSLEERYDS
jgi:hypothetical protein